MSGSQRLGRWVLALTLSAAGVGLGTALPAAADDDLGDADCVSSYLSRGRSVVAGPYYSIPYESIGGAPYVENEVNSRPTTYGIASNAHEGFIGDIVLGTSGFYGRNVTTAKAHWPPVPEAEGKTGYGTKSHTAFGPFAQSSAEAGPRKVITKAGAFGDPASPFGPSTAVSETSFDGKVVKGIDTVIGYDIRVGPVVIDKMHSTVEYETDGTEAGTKGTWKLLFSGVGGDKDKVYTITSEGFAPSGGDPQGGAEEIDSFNSGAAQFSDALESAGVGRSEAKIAQGVIQLDNGELFLRVAGLQMGMGFASRNDQIGDNQGMVFGFHERYLKVERGTCDADVSQERLLDYDEPPDTSVDMGPLHFPDPGSGGGYGGPKSTTAAPAVETAAPAPRVVVVRPIGVRYARSFTASV
ncbi:MAG: hypothetical protein ACRD0C_10755 [Acidimicrobiia bacterium]